MTAGLGLRGRIVAGVAAAVALVVAAAVLALAVDATRAARSRADALRSSLATRAAGAIADEGARLDRGAAASGTAPAAALGLDLLDRLAPDGRVLASRHWPERVGTRAAAEAAWPPGGPFVAEVSAPLGRRLALAVKRVEPDGSAVIAGTFLDGAVPVRFARLADEVAIVDDDGRIASSNGEITGETGRIRVEVPFAAPGEGPVARLVLAERVLAGGPDAGALAVLVVAALVALGVGTMLATRALRPVERFVRAIEAAASGEADFAFLERSGDAFGPLAAATSSLRRELDLERERLRAAERVAAWRETARRLAHELKNPLAPIRLTMENLIKARARAPERFDRLFEDGSRAVLEEVERLRRVVNEFSEYARLPQPRPRPTDLEDVLDGVLALYGSTPGVAIERVRAAELPPVAVDRDLIGLALRNLVANAIEAMPGGGRVRVATERDGRFAVVRILDEGPGFPQDALDRVFEPYFTTKPGGSGLGMAIVERVVSDHGGLVAAANDPGGGAAVTVRLPLRRGTGEEEPRCPPS